MIEVRNLTKRYGAVRAVSDLSFTVDKGRITGFLGPNGAGKSTTMNILTGCLGATEGTVIIDGHDVFEEPMRAKQNVGYLPEQPPLYPDMTPEEYLRFVLKAKGVPPREREAALAAVMDKTGIRDVSRRLIRNLSKGYRQRVGIAQALAGNPEVIILDEPTVGLDPAQIIEIRELIRSLGRDHTVILSSHILSEVSAVCDSILILAHGRLVAGDTPENLTRLFARNATLIVETSAAPEEARTILAPIAEAAVEDAGEGVARARLSVPDGEDVREKVFFAFAAAGKPILEMRRERASLEDVFLELTQEKPDEAEPARKKRGFRRKKDGESA